MGRDAPVGEREAEAARAACWEDLPFIEQMVKTACRDVLSMRGGVEFLSDILGELTAFGVQATSFDQDQVLQGTGLDQVAEQVSRALFQAAQRVLESEGSPALVARLMVGTFQGVPVGLLGVRMVVPKGAPPGSHTGQGFVAGSRPARLLGPWVEREARELGVGSALVRQARSWARSHGAAAIEAVVLPGDRLSKQLYEASHCIARALVMKGPIESEGTGSPLDG
jgi:ribosomal protein S18 acetylase RimI-like enzyme